MTVLQKKFMTVLQDFFYDDFFDNINSGDIETLHLLCQLKKCHNKFNLLCLYINCHKMCKIFVIVCLDETFYN